MAEAIAQELDGDHDDKIIILTNQPTELAALTSKKYLHLTRQLARQRASTLDPGKCQQITAHIEQIQRRTFSASNQSVAVFFAMTDNLQTGEALYTSLTRAIYFHTVPPERKVTRSSKAYHEQSFYRHVTPQ